jgi:hypothetical protein
MTSEAEKLWALLSEEVADIKEQVIRVGALASRLSSPHKKKWVSKASELATFATQLEKMIAEHRPKSREKR